MASRWILYNHGLGQSGRDISTNSHDRCLVNALVEAGYVVIASDYKRPKLLGQFAMRYGRCCRSGALEGVSKPPPCPLRHFREHGRDRDLKRDCPRYAVSARGGGSLPCLQPFQYVCRRDRTVLSGHPERLRFFESQRVCGCDYWVRSYVRSGVAVHSVSESSCGRLIRILPWCALTTKIRLQPRSMRPAAMRSSTPLPETTETQATSIRRPS